MNFQYWTSFSKRKNSTKQPTGSSTTATGYLKENTSMLNPVIVLDGNISADATYFYISSFGRYYSVQDIHYNGKLTEVSLTVDVMATYKSQIGSYNGMIARTGDVTFCEPFLADPMVKCTEEIQEHRATGSITLFGTQTEMFDENFGSYILTLVGKKTTSSASYNGFGVTYAISTATMGLLQQDFNDGTFIQQLKQEFANVMDCVIGCIWIPVPIANITGVTENIYFGSYNSGHSGLRITTRYLTGHNSISLPGAAKETTDKYLNFSPYSTYSCYFPFVGVVPIDVSSVYDDWQLHFFTYVDLFTGSVVYKIMNNADTKIFATYQGSCASDAPISNQRASATASLGGIASVIGGAVAVTAAAFTGGALLPGFAAMAGGAGASIMALEQHTQTNGAISTSIGALCGVDPEIMIFKKTITESFRYGQGVYGLPAYKLGTPASHTGFCQFLNPSIAISGFDVERTEVNDMAASGFFYE